MHRACLCLIFVCTLAVAEPVTLEKPIYAEVFLPGSGQRPTKVSGQLTRYDETQFTLEVGKQDRTLNWTDVTPTSAFTLRQRLIDKTNAEQWIELGEWGWKLGATDQSRAAFRQAVKLDPKLQKRADDAMSAASGTDAPAATPAAPADSEPDLIRNSDDPAPVAQPGRKKGEKVERIKYSPATPEQAAAAMARIRAQQKEVEKQIKVTLTEFETDHFIIFTDWDKREHDFLKKNLEEAYRVVSKQFDMSTKDNIFVGKLPVYMFARFDDFARFASTIDSFPVSQQVAGYFHGNEEGFGHMCMWKPDSSLTRSNNIKEAERLWAYVLVHEFTHAFLARYRSNEFIPRWLNEGIAEVIASGEFPYPERYRTAKFIAQSRADILHLFDDNHMPTGEFYPVMQTMVELLVRTNRKKFISLIDDIKDGVDPEEALQKHYKTTYAGFAESWRDWASKQNVR